MIRKEQETIVVAVIALLKGINVDGETMQYIIEQVGMEKEIKKVVKPTTIDSIANDIYMDLENEGVDLIDSVEYELNGAEIGIEFICLDDDRIKELIKDTTHRRFVTVVV
jgi:hypothetical protein